MNRIFKKIAFMAIGCAVGGVVEGGLTIADDRHTKKKLGLPVDATEAELRDALRENSGSVAISPEAQAILDSLK